MAAKSIRNYMSQVAALLVSSLVKGNHANKPSNLPDGSNLALSVMEQVTGMEMKPIKLHQHMNYDMTSLCTFEGDRPISKNSNNWARVSSKSLARGCRGTRSIWKAGEELNCNGLMVK